MRRVSPREAHELMHREGFVYLDVRTPTEFAECHPRGAVNIPFALVSEQGLAPNPTFVSDVLARLEPSTALVVGCASGVRSLAAAELLAQAGFSRLVEQRAGLSGVRDPFGRIKERGWRDEGLPVAHSSEMDSEERS